MLYQQLGLSSLHISRIGFGCMSLALDSSSERLILEAMENGVNYFDTADLYQNGANETMLGKAVRSKRKNTIIATKGGNQWLPDGSAWKWNASPEYLNTCVEKSLKRLGTDYIDLYQLHGGTLEDSVEEIISLFESLVQQGKIRFYGISSIRPNVISKWVRLSGMSSVMMQYSLLDRRPEEECFPLLQQHQVGVLARGSLAQGLLAGKPAKEYIGQSQQTVKKASSVIHDLSANNSPAAIGTAFTLQHPAVTSAVVGIRTREQLHDALQTMNVFPLSSGDYENLKKCVPAINYEQHRMSS